MTEIYSGKHEVVHPSQQFLSLRDGRKVHVDAAFVAISIGVRFAEPGVDGNAPEHEQLEAADYYVPSAFTERASERLAEVNFPPGWEDDEPEDDDVY